jgi:hypothetical protein
MRVSGHEPILQMGTDTEGHETVDQLARQDLNHHAAVEQGLLEGCQGLDKQIHKKYQESLIGLKYAKGFLQGPSAPEELGNN